MASIHKQGSLSDVPDDFGLVYLKAEISLRKKQKAHAFIAGCYVQSVRIYKEDGEIVSVRGEVYPSQRKHDARHVVYIQISTGQRVIIDAHCKCKQGDDGTCSHVVAVIRLIESWKVEGFKEVPSLLSSTSLPQQWDRPRGEKITAEPVSQMIISRPTNILRKRKPVVPDFHDNRKVKVTSDHIQELTQLTTSPISYLVAGAKSTLNTQCGECLPGSALSYQSPLISLVSKPREFTGCGDIYFPQRVDIDADNTNILTKQHHAWADLKVTMDESRTMEKSTRLQNESKLWHLERKKRITASSFGLIMKRKKDVNDSFLNNTFNAKPFQSKPTSYGIVNEKSAKAMYIKRTDSHVHDIGLTVNPEFPFLGASPDGIFCKNNDSGLLEVKCPYVARDMTIAEACTNIKDFCIKNDNDHFTINKEHAYYFQVQGQLLVTGAKCCDFVVFTKLDLFIERIYPNKEVMMSLLKRLTEVYVNNFKPFFNKNM